MRSMGVALVTVVVCSFLAFSACSGAETSPSPNPDAGSSGSSGATSSGATSSGATSSGASGSSSGGPCTALAQVGTSVDILATKAAQPAAAGGTPVDGTYVLTAARAFTSLLPDGNKVRTFGAYTLKITGKKFEQIVTNESNEVTIASGDLESSAVNFKATPTCQEPLPEAGVDVIEGEFTADAPDAAPPTLKMYVVRDFGITAELTFTKK